MSKWSKLSLETIFVRIVGYGALLFLVSWLTHLYVIKPLYIKRLPYFAEALWLGLDVDCDPGVPNKLSGMLRRLSLPYFARSGQITYLNSEGRGASCHVNTSNRSANVFRLASMTKVVTAFAMLDLAREQSINLDTEVTEYFPEVTKDQIQDKHVFEMTLSHLLNHSSGLGGPFGSDNMVKKEEKPWCPYDVSTLETVRLAGKPGTNHLYSNVAYCLLGEVIERVSGVEFQQYIRETYLSDYPTLSFIEGDYLSGEPDYDFSNDFRFGRDYVDWLDFNALSSSAGLMGDPKEFARLVWELYQKNPDVLEMRGVDGCRERNIERCYSSTFVIHEGERGVKVGVQQGYLPGASSLVAISERGEVLVWTAPGAPLESHHRDLIAEKVVSIMQNTE